MMIGKETLPLVALIIIVSTSKLCDANQQEPTNEDIEETSELVVNYLGPLLELNDFTLNDLPNHLKYLTAKYYLIFSRGAEPLDTLEQMVDDYVIIQNNQHIVREKYSEDIEHFVEINRSNNKKALKTLITKMLDTFDFRLQIVRPRDAVKFLLYEEAYPDIMKIISHMVRKHYDAYLKERAKEKGDTLPLHTSNNTRDDVDFDITSVVREFVASHGRLEFVKRVLSSLEQYVPPIDRADISESTLDYLDDLQVFLNSKSEGVWRLIKDAAYAKITNEWSRRTEEFLVDLMTVIPFEEIFNVFDALVLNSNDRRAFIIVRYELRKSDKVPVSLANGNDVFNFVSQAVIKDFTDIRKIFNDYVIGANKVVSEKVFLKFIDKLLAPYGMATNDLSKEILSIISRIFTRIDSIKGKSKQDKIIKADLLFVRKHLEQIRDAVGLLTPEHNESNHVELQNLLESSVNKFGAFILELEQSLVQFVNSLIGNPDNKRILEEKMDNFAQKFGEIFKSSGKKPSQLIKERFSEVVAIIDAFVNFTSL